MTSVRGSEDSRVQAAPPPVLRAVVFEGRKFIPSATLARVAGLEPGQKLKAQDTIEAFRRLVRYPYLREVKPPVIRPAAGGLVDLVFRIEERPVVGRIELTGNSAFRDAELLEILELRSGRPFEESALVAARKAVARHCHEDGFLLAGVEVKARDAGAGRKDVLVSISEGTRVTVSEVVLEGARHVNASEALSWIDLKPRRLFGVISKGYYVPEDVAAELQKLRRGYRDRGFLSATVSMEGVDLEPPFRKLRVRLRVREGPRYVLSGIRVEGSHLFPQETLNEAVAVPAGRWYSERAAEDAHDRLVRWYEEHGDRLPAIDVSKEYDERNRVTVVFKVREERFLETGEVRIRGNRVTKDRVFRNRIDLAPGRPFARARLRRSLEKLEKTGYLQSVQVDTDEHFAGKDNETIVTDVTFTVKEREQFGRLIEVGGGASSGAGAVGYVGIHRKNFDLFRLPKSWSDLKYAFTGGGQSLDFIFLPGTRESQYSFHFEEPYFFRSDLTLSLDAGISLLQREEHEELHLGGSAQLTKFLDHDHEWSLNLAYVADQVRVDDLTASAPPDVVASEGLTFVSYPRLELRFDELDRNYYSGPVGFLASAHGDFAYSAFGSDVDFARAGASAHWYIRIFDDRPDYRHVLHLGAEVRWVQGLGGDDVPVFERYYLGGPRTFRGFDYRDLGPHQEGVPVGGGGAVYGSVEYSLPVFWREVRAMALFDWGDLEPRFGDLAFGRFRAAVGGGIALRLGVFGQSIPVNIYWTQALASKREDRTQLFSFTLGMDF